MGRISRTIELAKASWAVLRKDRELAALPVLSFGANLVVLAAFAALVFLIGGDELFSTTTDSTGTTTGFNASPFVYVLALFAYLVATFVTVFFQTALVSGANEALDGGDPTLGSALHGATSRFHRIAPWALLTGSVGLILQAIENRAGFLGRIVANLIGAAWRIVTFLVIPILVVEDLGPIDATKRSAQLFKSTWGENLAAQMGFGLLGFLAMIPAFVVGGLAGASGVTAVAIGGIAAAVIWVAVVLTIVSALSGIFQMALYRYATTGETPAGFPSDALSDAFGPRKRGNR
jgi:hypothetical protein